uniref:Uncharacterized protein n=1 Tax=Arundo donax TaxID=35708 RepID=A0A0A9C8F8_ARUDO
MYRWTVFGVVDRIAQEGTYASLYANC